MKDDGKNEAGGVSQDDALQAVRTILRYIGEDPDREGLRETPLRVVKSWQRIYGGYLQKPDDVLKKMFSEVSGYDQLIVLGPIEFHSMCEHHMLPFYGSATVGYLPGASGEVVGISKLARLVEVYARRLQIQERLTSEIAKALEKAISPSGVGVVIRAQHMCMVARGVEKKNSYMTTSEMLGVLRHNPTARQEFLNLMRGDA